MKMLLIVVAGSLGCITRWGVEEIIERRVLSHRPYATLAVNAFGALIAGVVVFGSFRILPPTSTGHLLTPYGTIWLRQASPYLLTGFCGGFTTFSSAIAIPYLDWRKGLRLRATFLIGSAPLLSIAGYVVGEQIARSFA